MMKKIGIMIALLMLIPSQAMARGECFETSGEAFEHGYRVTNYITLCPTRRGDLRVVSKRTVRHGSYEPDHYVPRRHRHAVGSASRSRTIYRNSFNIGDGSLRFSIRSGASRSSPERYYDRHYDKRGRCYTKQRGAYRYYTDYGWRHRRFWD